MVRYEFPGEHDSQSGPNEKGKEDTSSTKNPELIYMEDVYVEAEQQEAKGQSTFFSSINQLEKAHYPFFLRALTFFTSLLLFILVPLFILFVAFQGFIAGLLLFRSASINANAKYYWKQLKKMAVIMFSLLIATVSPSFGLGIIVLYFVLQGEEIQSTFLNQMINPKRYK